MNDLERTTSSGFRCTASKAWLIGAALQLSAITCAMAQAFTVTPSSIVMPASGSAINVTLVPSGGVAPYQYLLSAGRLPAGVSLSGAGVLSGTLAENSPNFTITVSDDRGDEVDVLSIVIALTAQPAPMVVGSATNAVLSAAGGSGPYQFALAPGASLPAGLSLNTNGSLSGTPTTSGTFTVPVVITDSTSASTTVNATFTINAAPVALSIATPPALNVGSPASVILMASGGTAPYQFVLTSGSLPAGLTLNLDGSLTGSPSVSGTTVVTITVTDNTGVSTPNPVTFVVHAVSAEAAPTPVPWNAPWALLSSSALILLGWSGMKRRRRKAVSSH
ncbi:hypothetical protein G7048_27860 (plasmid) [Diaphorobacter sp. HDW4B]|uniref:Ig domain-containing protein n=1 Tax=Diaphorobacter sp. HDW4B TaxID=2714925 RepID=UPI0014089A1F|nr:Ig domain-containing protein [Diaphorobacter sp. HDW4B]QIL74284.1 hypothetical protein G7048_27860 [Diaphorobacter sp. HDW4B]